jgi:hypothetical protein
MAAEKRRQQRAPSKRLRLDNDAGDAALFKHHARRAAARHGASTTSTANITGELSAAQSLTRSKRA